MAFVFHRWWGWRVVLNLKSKKESANSFDGGCRICSCFIPLKTKKNTFYVLAHYKSYEANTFCIRCSWCLKMQCANVNHSGRRKREYYFNIKWVAKHVYLDNFSLVFWCISIVSRSLWGVSKLCFVALLKIRCFVDDAIVALSSCPYVPLHHTIHTPLYMCPTRTHSHTDSLKLCLPNAEKIFRTHEIIASDTKRWKIARTQIEREICKIINPFGHIQV